MKETSHFFQRESYDMNWIGLFQKDTRDIDQPFSDEAFEPLSERPICNSLDFSNSPYRSQDHHMVSLSLALGTTSGCLDMRAKRSVVPHLSIPIT